MPQESKVKRSGILVYAAVAAYSTGQGMVIPAIPLFAYSLGATQTVLGILGALPAVTCALLAVKFGQLSEKKNRKNFLVLGSLLYLLVSLAYLISSNLNHIFVIRPFEGVSFALFWPCAEAYIADLDDKISRRRALGYYTLAWSGGTTSGPIIGGYLISKMSFGSPFIACAVTMLIALFFTAISTEEKRNRREILRDGASDEPLPLRSILYAILGYSFVQSTVLSLYPVHGSVIGFSEIEIGMLLSLVGLARTVIFAVSTFWGTPPEAQMATVGYSILAVSLGLLPILNQFHTSATSFVMMGVGLGLVYTSIIDLAMSHQRKGSAAGAFESGIGLGAVVGPFVSGIAAEHVGMLAAYWLSSFFAIIGVLVAKKAYGKRKQQDT